MTLPKLCRVTNFGVNAVVQKHESQQRQDPGDQDLGPVPAEHDVAFVAHDFGRSERIPNFESLVGIDQHLFGPEFEESAGVDGHRSCEDQNDEEDGFGLVL